MRGEQKPLSVWSWCEAIDTWVKDDASLRALGVSGAHYQFAPSGVGGNFVVHQMQSGTFDRTMGGIVSLNFSWQFSAVAPDSNNLPGVKYADAITLRLFELLDEQEDFVSSWLEPLGFSCELVRATGYVPPRREDISGAVRWRCGHYYEFQLEPLD